MTNRDAAELRKAFSSFMTGVTVVTTQSNEGVPIGFTANSFTSVSLDPPMVLVCCGHKLSCLPVFQESRRFAINILSEDQQDISDRFARFQGDRFEGLDWQNSELGNPLIHECSAWFDCRLDQTIDAGDHLILLGEVTGYHHADLAGLGFYRGGYFKPALERRAAEVQSRQDKVLVGAIVEEDGALLLLPGEGDTPILPAVGNDTVPGTQSGLKKFVAGQGIEIELGPIYSVFEDEQSGQHSIYYRASILSSGPEARKLMVPIDEFVPENLGTPALTSMMQRYVRESSDRLFGVYYGTDREGQVEKLARQG